MRAKRGKKNVERSRAIPIDIRDKRFEGGRFTISSRTKDPTEFALRKAAVYALLEDGARGMRIIECLKSGELRIKQVAECVHGNRIDELGEADTPEAVATPQMLGATIDRFLLRVKAKQAVGTFVGYRGFCRGMEAAFGVVRGDDDALITDVPISDITPQVAERWLFEEKATIGKAWSARRQVLAHNVAHQVWGLAIEADEDRSEQDGLPRTITRNLWGSGKSRVRPPRIRKTRVVFLSREKAGRLLWATRGRPEAVLMALGIYGGLRAGEAINLRTSVDVRLAEGCLAIQPREGAYPWRPKTDNSIRDVPLHPRLARWIRAHVREGYAGETYLIRPSQADKPISPKTRERWVIDAFRRAGIDYGRDKGQGATLHTLRHTFASWLAQQDVQLMKIAALMGDTVIEVERTYAHLLPQDLRGAVQRLDKKR